MSIREDLETFDPAADVQKAFDESASIKFDNKNLPPWTTRRQCAALLLKCQIISNTGKAAKELVNNNYYPSILRDVIIVLWVLSLDADEVKTINALTGAEPNPDDLEKAFDWAERVGLEYGNGLFFEGIEIMVKILKEINASTFSVEPGNGGELSKKNSTDQLGKSNSLGAQAKQADIQPSTS
jgi:hypothetical protein